MQAYLAGLAEGAAHDPALFAERIASWLVEANVRVRIIGGATFETVKAGILADPHLRRLTDRSKSDAVATRVLRAAGVSAKKAWNAVNAAEAMKETRRRAKRT